MPKRPMPWGQRVIVWLLAIGLAPMWAATAFAQAVPAAAPTTDAAAGEAAEPATPAGPKVASPFEIMPVDTEMAVIVPSMTALSRKLGDLNENTVLEVEWMSDALGEFSRATSLRNGVDHDGAFIIAVTNMQNMGSVPEPPVVMIVKVDDFDQFLKNYDGQVNADIAEFFLSAGQRVFAKHIEGYAVMSSQLALIENYLPGGVRGKDTFTTMIGKTGEDALARSDAAIIVDLQKSRTRITREVDDWITKQKPITAKQMRTEATKILNEVAYNMVASTTRAVLRDGTGAVLAMNFPKEGVSMSFTLQFRPGSDLAKRFSNGDDVSSALNRLPLRPFIAAQAVDLTGINQKELLDAVVREFDNVARNPWSDLVKTVTPLIQNASAISFVVFDHEQISLGSNLFNGTGVIDANDVNTYLRTTSGPVFNDLDDMRVDLGDIDRDAMADAIPMGLSKNELIINSKYRPTFLVIDNVSVDQYEIQYSLPPAVQAMLGEEAGTVMMLGGNRQAGYFAPAGNSVIFTTATDAPLLKDALSYLKNQRGLGIEPSFKALRAQLDERPSFELFFNTPQAAGLLDKVNRMIRGDKAELLRVPTDSLPSGLSVRVQDYGIAARVFVPNETIRSLVEVDRRQLEREAEATEAEGGDNRNPAATPTTNRPPTRPTQEPTRRPTQNNPRRGGGGPPPGSGGGGGVAPEPPPGAGPGGRRPF